METRAKLSNLRIAPRKVRLVADIIRRKKVGEARAILNFSVKKAGLPLLKLLNSAIANAKNNFQIEADNLYISKITVDEGPKYKRWMPRARGQATEIQKKTSHITLILDEISPLKKHKKAKTEKSKKPSFAKTLKGKEEEKVESKIEAKEEKVSDKERTKPQAEEQSSLRGKQIKPELKAPKPKTVRGVRRIFARKAI